MNNREISNQESKFLHPAISPEQLQQIEAFANSIHFGSITLLIQDNVLIQIEKNEKIRINPQ